MKLSFQSKLMGLVVFALVSILSVSACSIAFPEFLHISNIELTDDESKIHLRITDKDYNNWDLVYSLSENEIQTSGSEQIVSDLELIPSTHNYFTRLYENQNLTNWELKDNENNVVFDIELAINASEGVNSPYGFTYFVSEKLNTAYLIIPYFTNEKTNSQFYGNYATVIIAEIDNIENLTYLNEIEWYNNMYSFSTSNEVYDEYQLIRIQGNGADCVNSVYFKFYINDFEFLIKTTAGQSEVSDPRTGFMFVSSYQWTNHTSTIQVIDLKGFNNNIHTVKFNPEVFETLIENGSVSSLSESLGLPILTLFTTSIGLFATLFFRKKI